MKHFILLIFLGIGIHSYSQDLNQKYLHKVTTLDSTIYNLYAVISGEKGVKRNWELFQYLFVPEAKLIPSGKDSEGKYTLRYMSPLDYVQNAGSYLEANGFYEKEIYRINESFGQITHIFSTYESYHSAKDNQPFARGINSIQLFNDGTRWWILSIYWTAEREDLSLPKKYLPKK